MKIAVMSDTHDNIWNLMDVLEIIKEENCEMIIHCGDFVSPFMLKELAKAEIPVHGVLGNNDGDQYLLTKISCEELEHVTLHGLKGVVDVDGKKICFTHDGDMAEGLAATGHYDMVCFGHTHVYEEESFGGTLLLNPGEVMGKEGHPSFCIIDSKNLHITKFEI